MGMIGFLAKKSFKKIFHGIAKELETGVENIQLGICYKPGGHTYEAYKNYEKEKDVALDDYFPGVDLSGGTAGIDATIGNAGPMFVKEASESLKKPVSIEDIFVIMKYLEGGFPVTALMVEGKKLRLIDIEKEFLK